MLWWTDDLKTGVFDVDKQHKDIFDKANEIFDLGVDADIKQLKKVFAFLNDYSTNHFHDEEQLMLEHNYKDLTEHRKQHNYFMQEVHRISQNLNDNNITERDLNDLKVLVIDWLANHINREDKMFIQSI